MIQDNIENFKGGWFVGDFKPSLFKNPFFEVEHHKHMWIYEPNEVSDVENLTDNELVVVRWPSIPSDKYKAKIV